MHAPPVRSSILHSSYQIGETPMQFLSPVRSLPLYPVFLSPTPFQSVSLILLTPHFPPFLCLPPPSCGRAYFLGRLNNTLYFNITTAAGTSFTVVPVLLCLSSVLPILIIIVVLSPVPHITGITVETDQVPLLSLIIALFVNVYEIRLVKYSRHELISFDLVWRFYFYSQS